MTDVRLPHSPDGINSEQDCSFLRIDSDSEQLTSTYRITSKMPKAKPTWKGKIKKQPASPYTPRFVCRDR